MSDKEKLLPTTSSGPFGRKKRFDQEEKKEELLADQIAMAMAQGRLDEFMKKVIPDNQYARKLAEMMIGMSGMMPPKMTGSGRDDKREEKTEQSEGATAPEPPEEVLRAAQSGDVRGLMEILHREYRKRVPDAATQTGAENKSSPAENRPVAEKEMIDLMISIASENSVSLDWLIMRAVKIYIREYQRTGRL